MLDNLTTKLCFKCRKCALEYAIYTNYPENWQSLCPFCPECGHKEEKDRLLLATHESPDPISRIIYNKGIM